MIKTLLMGLLAVLSLAMMPLMAWSSCSRSRVVVVKRAAAVQAEAAVLVPVAVAVPAYSVSYNTQQAGESDVAHAIRELAKAVEAIGGRVPAGMGNGNGLTYQAVMTARCAQCHQDGKAGVSGMVLVEKDGTPAVLSLAEKRRIIQLVEAGDMPPRKNGVLLSDAEKAAFRAQFAGK